METDCYCTSLRSATRKLTALYDAALEPAGVNVAQWGLLRRLDTAQPDPVSIQTLAERAELERSTVARNVRVLEKLDLVRLGESRQDRRLATIALTAAGRTTLERGAPLWEAAQSQVEERLGSTGAHELRSVLLSL
ncbi:MAG: transcriptional regulator, MarR family [Nocardioidaceae bacterium]|nr:transcriptional regulator, MarR family [Nocardioidaceae bacterium]